MNPPVLSVLALSRSSKEVRVDTTDLCRMHARIIDATVGMPDGGPRTLWAQPTPTTLTIRAAEPVTAARLPARYATAIAHRPWPILDQPGQWTMAAVVNPARSDSTGGPTLNQPDRRRISLHPRLYTEPEEQIAWLGRRRTGRTITVRRVHVRALWQVDDPQAMTDRLTAGVGIDKTWGCGLTMWNRWGR